MIANQQYQAGILHAWDKGGAPYDRNESPYPIKTDGAREFYLGYKEGCRQIRQHRIEIGAIEKEPTSYQTADQQMLNL